MTHPPAVFNTDVIQIKEFPAHFQPVGWSSATEARGSVRAVRNTLREEGQKERTKTDHITFTDVYVQE